MKRGGEGKEANRPGYKELLRESYDPARSDG
jgi:hypothetical protein